MPIRRDQPISDVRGRGHPGKPQHCGHQWPRLSTNLQHGGDGPSFGHRPGSGGGNPLDRGLALLLADPEGCQIGALPRLEVGARPDVTAQGVDSRRTEGAVAVEEQNRKHPWDVITEAPGRPVRAQVRSFGDGTASADRLSRRVLLRLPETGGDWLV